MSKLNKIKSALISSAMAVSAVVSPLAGALTPSLTVNAAGSDDYARILQYSLYLYDANMCGDEVKSKSGMEWRGNCHTDDEVPGGFHDAGDHAMFGLPQGFTASTLGWAYYEFKDAFKTTGQDAHLKVITDYFCDFFKRSTKLSGGTVTNFLYQKGDGNADHSYWGPPEKQGGGRKMFWTSNGASDIAADYAAALALNYLNFGNEEDLTYAKALYDFSTKGNQVATEGPAGFYKSSGCQDEQANAAGWLYMATKEEKYKSDCASKQTQYLGWIDGWDNRGLGAGCVYAEITGDWSKVNLYVGGKANGNNYLFLDKWGSARLNGAMQFAALVASKHSNADYAAWCKGQMSYLMGDNPANTCFLTGFASNSAKNAHHRAASGYNSYDEFNGSEGAFAQYGPNGHTLIGALVGGPSDAGGTYQDNMNDYVCNEVAIDYNAGFVGAAAGLYETYKTGSIDKAITGVNKIYEPGTPLPSGPVSTTPPSDQPSTQAPQEGGDKVLTDGSAGIVFGTEEGDGGDINNYAEFAPMGAKSATLYLKVNSNDTEVSGAFGTYTGTWTQKDFSKVPVGSDKTATVDYTIPANVGNTVKAMVFWPHGDGVTIEKVVLHMDDTPSVQTTKPQQTTQAQQQQTTKATTQAQQTQAPQQTTQNQNVSGTKFDVKDTYEGVIGDMIKSGAKSITFYINASGATAFTYGFGVSISKDPWWNELDASGKFIDTKGGTVNADGTETKLSAGLNKVTIDLSSIPVNYADSSSEWGEHFEFRNYYSDKNVTLTITDVKMNDSSAPVTTAPAVTTKATTKATTAATTKATTAATTKATTQAQQQPQGNIVYGDSNCDNKVNIADAVAILQYLANGSKYPLTDQGKKNADVDGSAGVTGNDALTIQKYDAGSLTKLPV